MAAQLTGDLACTDDAFLAACEQGPLSILQPVRGYRAGLDAVLLAAAARVPEHATAGQAVRVLDAGSGVGVVGLCVARRLPGTDVTLVEKSADLAALARRNVRRNGLDQRIRVAEGDVLAAASSPITPALEPGSFDVLLSNPPYYEDGRGRSPADPLKAGSHTLPPGSLDGWMRFLARMAAPDASVTVVHRADTLPDLLSALEGRFGAIELLPLHPRAGEPAHRILVHARRGSRAPLVLRAGLVIHDTAGGFMPAIEAVLRAGAGLGP